MVEVRRNVVLLFWVGLVLTLVGSVLGVVAWPDGSGLGSVWVSLAAGVVGCAGAAMVSVCLVAWGVRLGIEGAARR